VDLVSGSRAFGARARVRPGAWLADLAARGTAPSALQACVGQGRLVVLAPHPDDEVLACGGLLVQAGVAGWPVQIVAITDGERSHGALSHRGRSRLARQRAHEQRRALQALGVRAHGVQRLRLPDGGVAHRQALLQRQLAALLRPDDALIVTTAWDGHPDHEATARAARAAARSAGCRLWEAPVWLWQWAGLAADGPPWPRLRRFELDGTAQRRKLHALRCHRSQQQPRAGGEAVLCRDIRRRAAWPAEFFFESLDDRA